MEECFEPSGGRSCACACVYIGEAREFSGTAERGRCRPGGYAAGGEIAEVEYNAEAPR